jgi:ATP adenylyltransferase
MDVTVETEGFCQLNRDNIRPRVEQSFEHAVASSELQTIATVGAMAQSTGLPIMARLRKRPPPKSKKKKLKNPFLPYNPSLYVGDISSSHICLLNKFNVMPRHLLMVAREEEDQSMPLTPADFFSLSFMLAHVGGLAFYNSSELSGASVNHKHLQIISSPLADKASFPFETILNDSLLGDTIGCIEGFPFPHLAVRIPATGSVLERANFAYQNYLRMVARLGLIVDLKGWLPPYNLLMCKNWLWLVPRKQPSVEGIAINALAYAGAVLFDDRKQLQQLAEMGFSDLLQRAAKD